MANAYFAQASAPVTPYQSVNAGVIPPEVLGVAVNYYINRCPLATRLPKLPCGSMSFKITKEAYRPRSFTLAADLSTTDGTTLTPTDASQFIVGDVIEVGSEIMLVTAVGATTVTVTRGYVSSTAATHTASGLTGYLITNTRTGAEVDQTGLSRIPVVVEQLMQTIQHPYSVGGSLQSATNYVSAYNSPLDRDRTFCLQHVLDDLENAIYYGKGLALAADTTRPAMYGLRSLLTTNNTTSPTNAGAYSPSDLIRDTIQACRNQGSRPNLLVVSSDWLSGLAKWGFPALRLDAGTNAFGTAIDLFYVSFLPAINIIEAPLLRKGTVLCLNTDEVRLRVKRPLFDKPRGSRGDATEGDFILEAALEIENEHHHAFVSGVTGWAAA